MKPALRPVQVAYHVPDPEAAAVRCARDFGWGPFFLMEHIPLERSLYRGAPAEFDHTSAYGQAGELMVELITQHNDGPSALRDLFAPHETGVHHVACFVADLPAELQRYREQDVAIALEARTKTGVDFAMVDVSALARPHARTVRTQRGPAPLLRARPQCADGWDGDRPVRRLRG